MRKNVGLKIFAGFVFAFLFVPLLIIVVTSFGTNSTIQFPIEGFTLDWFGKVFNNESFMNSFLLSLQVAFIATLLALIIGVPAAYSLARHKVLGRSWIKSFFLSPTIVPGLVVGYALYQFIVIQFQFPIFQGLLLGHFLICLPYVIRVVGSTIEQLDFSIEEVSWTLGCTKLQTFSKVVLPNITSGIFASFMLAFINSFNNIPVSQFLSGPGVTMLPTSLMNYIEYNYDPSVSALSVILMLGTIVLMVIIEKSLGLASIS
ncbi:ABC transporter permease [Bacillus sp. ISL-40]|uniref:ABC transporter permease n=1 Tax=unclassified Bacillus (in: firmicutes) TaxID=185979 RepID=UPI001BE9BDB7|nr:MULTISPECIES: ABC transporter permease [unclassified Bacillus (in: firmicutes)]MBT2695846.1 ABC transporter permease [Bacillus sp. ISL-40]MBT2724461.1 ABC transporter permease [Bacillus sp. ISL-46]MBT2743674.1 ABC transporter permease [Bacillus sp. ISL-77]